MTIIIAPPTNDTEIGHHMSDVNNDVTLSPNFQRG